MGFTDDFSKTQPQQLCEKHNIMYRGVCPLCIDRIDPNAPWMPGTVYAQKTPSGDIRLFKRDGSIYITAWSPYQSGCPRKNSKSVVVNGYRWRLVWLPGKCLADAHSESQDYKIIRQHGDISKSLFGKPRRKRAAKPRLTR